MIPRKDSNKNRRSATDRRSARLQRRQARTPRSIQPTNVERSDPSTTQPSWILKRLDEANGPDVQRLLSFLPTLYPGAEAWLANAIEQTAKGEAVTLLAVHNREPVGIVIEKPKGCGRVKLSTFFVADGFRRVGIGNSLLENRKLAWEARGVSEVYITFSKNLASHLAPFLERHGFRNCGVRWDRYGPGRHEQVMSLTIPSK